MVIERAQLTGHGEIVFREFFKQSIITCLILKSERVFSCPTCVVLHTLYARACTGYSNLRLFPFLCVSAQGVDLLVNGKGSRSIHRECREMNVNDSFEGNGFYKENRCRGLN
jgi:hypothetical protein